MTDVETFDFNITTFVGDVFYLCQIVSLHFLIIAKKACFQRLSQFTLDMCMNVACYVKCENYHYAPFPCKLTYNMS